MEQMQFKVSSALKDLVGKDLIINDNIAIFELVKNSYDAYATKVEIKFSDNEIVIADNGKGMSFDDLKNKWLFLGYSAKKDGTEDAGNDVKQKSYRDKIKRHYAGSKGIGRFSCDRLGKHLSLTTKSENSHTIETIIVDWTDFEVDQKKEFAQIDVEHISQEKKSHIFPLNSETGTILKISDLNDEKLPWNRKRLLDLKRSLEKLINPLSETNDFIIEIICEKETEEDKRVRNNGGHDRDIVNGILKNSISQILKLKTTQIDVRLDKNYIYTIISDRGVDIYKIRENNTEFTKLEDVKINLYFLNRSAKNNFTRLMGIEPKNYGSIFLFRNGFRIMPFGNTGDDSWGLDYRAQQGHSRFLGTRDLFGRVDVLTDSINEFKEVSSRDGGLIETQTSKQLFSLFEIAHRRLERYVSGVLWGEAFLRKEYFVNEAEGLRMRKELLEIDKDEENPNYVLSSSIGSKIDFVQLIKALVRDKNIEIILVDDGSTDSSGEICDQYAREDDRIKVLHIENGGLSNARNTGVKESSTDWIVFIDSDDYYDHRAIEYLVELRDKYRVDLVATPVIEVRNYTNSDFLGDFREKYSGKLDRQTALKQMFYGNYVGTHSGGKLYKKEILLRFPYPNGMIYEDLAIAYEHIASCENIAVSDLNLYKYYRRPGSIVNSKYSDRLLDFYKAMEWNRSYIERDYSGDKDMRRALNVRYVFNGLHIVHAMLSSDMYAEVNKIRKEYIQYFKDVVPNSNVTRKNKMKYILLLVSAKLYKKIRRKIA